MTLLAILIGLYLLQQIYYKYLAHLWMHLLKWSYLYNVWPALAQEQPFVGVLQYTLFYKQHFYKQRQAEIDKKTSKC